MVTVTQLFEPALLHPRVCLIVLSDHWHLKSSCSNMGWGYYFSVFTYLKLSFLFFLNIVNVVFRYCFKNIVMSRSSHPPSISSLPTLPILPTLLLSSFPFTVFETIWFKCLIFLRIRSWTNKKQKDSSGNKHNDYGQ